ncbi:MULTISPECIES: ParA family protein [unclassified Arthrobacter]|uniref:ParA family protein n=1 Tax=unclassified Arthrobacter TaxID=235627 RepID=UPI001D15915D|nr:MULTISPECIES: ParA family protein [unclassified Arthrobacter]MCC3279710.1 ParA family protein [Arthrobacter sp. zg-Y40]MCC9178111.1 ParA family protein [Arthrobacter sp. zg-Y750]MCC3274296.1 ParA family protein [Arthrobacter sp. zg-Y20]MDK1314452.1 ParA family protein [Arthrobacter sp. zg.Y20]MDK1327338.1 ParA family protein [Arthrobacter sp. zg-Y1143]
MQVVSISSLKGGVGKTSVTLGLASAALAAGIPTLVVDLDPHADATTGLGVSAGNQLGIGEMLRSPRRVQFSDNVVPSGWVENARRLAKDTGKRPVLDVAMGSAYSGIYDRPDLGKRDLRRLTNLLSRVTGYGLVLIDCPPSLNGLTRMAWTASNRVLLVAEPGLFSVAGTERTMRALELFREEFAPNLAPAGIIANRVRPSSNEHVFRLAEMKQMFGDLLLSPTIAEQANWQQIQGAAHSVHHWPGESAKQASGTFDALLKNLMDTGSVRNRVMRRPVA